MPKQRPTSIGERQAFANGVAEGKRELLHEILGLFGDDRLTMDQFLALMRQHKLTDDDIDLYLRGELE